MSDISSIEARTTPIPGLLGDGRRPRRRTVGLLAIGGLIAALGLTACGDGSPTTATSSADQQLEGIVRPEPLQVGDLTLPQVDADGTEAPFTFRAEAGHLLFVAFGYTNCPDVCPTTLYDIKKARKDLGADGDRIDVAFATVDPKRDTPEIIAAYLDSFVPGSHPLRTEDRMALELVQQRFGVTSSVVENPDGSTDVAHSARSFVIDDQGQVVVEWSFGTGPDAMANDLGLLLEREAAGP